MGKTGKKRKVNHATKVTKIPKTNRRKYGMNETKNRVNKLVSLTPEDLYACPTYNRKKVFCRGTKYVNLLVNDGLTLDKASYYSHF